MRMSLATQKQARDYVFTDYGSATLLVMALPARASSPPSKPFTPTSQWDWTRDRNRAGSLRDPDVTVPGITILLRALSRDVSSA